MSHVTLIFFYCQDEALFLPSPAGVGSDVTGTEAEVVAGGDATSLQE